jgi:propanol-preferring alcohol dehydrogenase
MAAARHYDAGPMASMRAMVLPAPGEPLRDERVQRPTPQAGEVLIEVRACAVCRTDLHVIDGDLEHPKLPLVPGHEIVGHVAELGPGATRFAVGQRVGVPWLGWTCVLGLYGFGASAHIVAQVARWEGRRVLAFTRPGDVRAQQFARELGAHWAGGSDELAPEPLDAAILFAPVGALVPAALRSVVKGGVVVCAGIHMSDIPSFPYSLLWGERVVRSVANLTRRDGEEFLALAPRVPVRTHTQPYELARANEALAALRGGELSGAAVLVPR